MSTATLYVGPSKTGKTRAILARYARECRARVEPMRVLLLVPSRRHARLASRRLAQTGQALFTPGMLTLEDLARHVLLAAGREGPSLDDAGRSWLIRRVARDLVAKGRLRVLRSLPENPGLLNALSKFFKELKHSEIFFERLKEGLRRKGPDPKDQELLALYAAYQKALVERGMYDREGLLWQAKTILERDANLLGTEIVLVDGFDSFTPTQIALLKALRGGVQELIVTLTSDRDEGLGIFQRSRKTHAQLSEAFRLRERWFEDSSARIAQSLFRQGSGHGPGPRLYLHESADMPSEIRWCLGRVKEEARRVPSREIVLVATRDCHEMLQAECRRQGMPSASGMSGPLAETALFRHARALWHMAIAPDLENVLAVLETPGCSMALAARGLPPAWWIRKALREGGIRHLHGDWQQRLHWALSNRLSLGKDQVQSLPGRLADLVAELGSWPAKGVQEHLDLLAARMRDWGLDLRARAVAPDRDVSAAAEWNTFWETAREFGHFARHWLATDAEGMGLRAFTEDFEAFAAHRRMPRPSQGLTLLDPHDLRGASYAVVFFLGLNEGIFPAPPQRDPLFTPTERKRMLEAGLDLRPAPGAAEHRDEEGFLFYQVIASARDALYASYHRSGAGQTRCLPSRFFQELRSAYPDAPVATDAPWPSAQPESWACLEDSWAALCLGLHEKSGSGLADRWQALAPQRMEQLRRRTALEWDREGRNPLSPWDGQLRDKDLVAAMEESFGFGSVSSASRLNEYAKCPFRFYARYPLKIVAAEETDEELFPSVRGTLVHDILWKLYDEHFRKGPVADVPAAVGRMKAALPATAAHAFATLQKEFGILHSGVWHWQKERLLRRLKDLLDFEEEFFRENPHRRPAFFELSFGMGNSPDQDPASRASPISLGTGKERIRLRGRIDRVDMEEIARDGKAPSGYWVLDYKTGNPSVSVPDIRKGKDVQLPVYLAAAGQILRESHPGAIPLGAALYRTWPPAFKAKFQRDAKGLKKGVYQDSAWESDAKQATDRVLEHAGQISRGRFTPTPPEGKCVANCEYRSACRVDMGRLQAKTEARDA